MMKKLFLVCCLISFSLPVSANQIRPKGWDDIKHIVIIPLENVRAREALKQPFLKELTTKGAYLSNYFAVTHPSQPNYIALTGGGTLNVRTNNNVDIKEKSIVDLLEAKSLTWKAYAEDFPSKCFLGARSGNYARKHAPLISYVNIQQNANRCSNIVPGSQFAIDVATGNLPAYSFYTPNLKNDGHDTGVRYADRWLESAFDRLMKDPAILKDTLFIVTFDEDDGGDKNHVYTVFVGAGVKAGFESQALYSHYSLLKTIEMIFGLGDLGQKDKSAPVISDVWVS